MKRVEDYRIRNGMSFTWRTCDLMLFEVCRNRSSGMDISVMCERVDFSAPILSYVSTL